MNFKDFIREEKEKHAVLAFGRMNPPTVGHEKLVDKVKQVAKEVGGTHHVVLSHSQDPGKNPLTSDQKLKHAKRFFPDTNLSVSDKEHPNFLSQAAKLHKAGVTHLHMIAGSDRTGEYHKLLHKYNGVKGPHGHFNFKKIEVHSAGERDPDAEGTAGMSASKMRGHATSGNFREFKKGIPSHVHEKHAKELYNDVRKGMSVKEEITHSLDFLFEQQLNEGVHDKGIFKAVFLSGGPGSGKDYVLDKTLSGQGLTEINSDKALEFLMDKESLDKRMPESEKEARDLVRGRAKNVTELKQRLALLGRNGLIINGTGDDLEKVSKIKKRLEDLGYETSMITVNTANEVSQQRNIDRGQRGGRTVPENIRKEKWEGVQNNRPKFAELFKGNYHEFDNSEDLRKADPEVKQAKEKELLDIFKKMREFTSKPAKHPEAQNWIADELNKKDALKVSSKGAKLAPHPESGAYQDAKKLGLDYMGFGRYGKNGKVTHHSIHDKLIEVGKYKAPQEKSMPVSGTSASRGTLKKESIDSQFDSFLQEAVSFTIQADTPEELKKTLQLIKSEEEVDEEYRLSDSGALNLLTLGTQIRESVEAKDYLKDANGKPRKYMLRRAASKDAHTKNGEVEKNGNHYLVKIKGEKNVSIPEESVQYNQNRKLTLTSFRRTNESRTGEGRENGSPIISETRSTKRGEAEKETSYSSYHEEAKPKGKKEIKEIDFGTEVGMPLAGYNKEKIDRKTGKAVTELTGDETGASIGANKEDELQKQGISLSSFKAKRGNIS
jgi:hypothetical protein